MPPTLKSPILALPTVRLPFQAPASRRGRAWPWVPASAPFFAEYGDYSVTPVERSAWRPLRPESTAPEQRCAGNPQTPIRSSATPEKWPEPTSVRAPVEQGVHSSSFSSVGLSAVGLSAVSLSWMTHEPTVKSRIMFRITEAANHASPVSPASPRPTSSHRNRTRISTFVKDDFRSCRFEICDSSMALLQEPRIARMSRIRPLRKFV